MPTLNENILFAYNDAIARATFLAVGTAVASLPATNLQDRRLSRPWRTSGVSAPNAPTTLGPDKTGSKTWVDFQLTAADAAAGWQVVALVGHNLTASATWRVLADDYGTWGSFINSPVYDSGDLPLAMLPDPRGVSTYYTNTIAMLILPTALTYQYLHIELRDITNPDGYLQVGRLFVSPIWQPSVNIQQDWSLQWTDLSEATRTMGGELVTRAMPRYRTLQVNLEHIPEDEMHQYVATYLDRYAGTTTEMIVLPQPQGSMTYNVFNEAIYGRLKELDAIRAPYADTRRARSLQIEEFI